MFEDSYYPYFMKDPFFHDMAYHNQYNGAYYPYLPPHMANERWYTIIKVIDHVVSANACQAECSAHDQCLFFSYTPGQCLLKIPRAYAQIGITSGTRYGIGEA